MMGYYTQLAQPEWKEKSHNVKVANNWTCQHCGRKEGRDSVVMEIHHPLYIRGKLLWNYADCLLLCLCGGCHEERQRVEDMIYLNVADYMHDKTNQELLNLPFFTLFPPSGK